MEQWLSTSGMSGQTADDRRALTELRKLLWAFQLDEEKILKDYHRRLAIDLNPSVGPSTLLEFAFSRVQMSNASAANLFNCILRKSCRTQPSTHA